MARAYVKFRTSVPLAEIPVAVTVTEVGSHGVYINIGNVRVAMLGTAGDLRYLSYRHDSKEINELQQMGVRTQACRFDRHYRRVESSEQNA